MSARDELAELIAFETGSAQSGELVRCGSDGETPVFKLDQQLADAILADGYRKPYAIATTEDLDALPEGAVVIDAENEVSQKRDGGWCGFESFTSDQLARLASPFTVIHEPVG